MPKRIIDGEGVWRSDKLAQVEPPSFRSEYTNLLPLALANGSFEVNARRIWSTVYSYNRPDIELVQVEQILAEFVRVKLLFRWIDDATGKEWGYWVGIEKAGRLPTPSRLKDRHERMGLVPPPEKLAEFAGNPMGTQLLTDEHPIGSLGSGLGSGSGSGCGDGNSLEIARALCSENGWSGQQMIWALKEAIDFQSARMPEASLEQIGEWLVKAYSGHRASKGDYARGPQKFFQHALYRPWFDRQRNGKVTVSNDDLVARTLAQLEAK